MIRAQIQLTEEQAKTLKKIAGKKHVSMAELIRQGVNNLMRSSGEVTMEERKKRAVAAKAKELRLLGIATWMHRCR